MIGKLSFVDLLMNYKSWMLTFSPSSVMIPAPLYLFIIFVFATFTTSSLLVETISYSGFGVRNKLFN